jgi:hypothetical protein
MNIPLGARRALKDLDCSVMVGYSSKSILRYDSLRGLESWASERRESKKD